MNSVGALIDKSALARLHISAVTSVLEPVIQSGRAVTCGMALLEMLYSARGFDDLIRLNGNMRRRFRMVDTIQADFDRAIDVLSQLSRSGMHRSAAIPDLLIAALAERHDLTIIHYDQDFDNIAGITGQRTQWVVPRGSI